MVSPDKDEAHSSYAESRKKELLGFGLDHARYAMWTFWIWMGYGGIVVGFVICISVWKNSGYFELPFPLVVFFVTPIFAMLTLIGTAVHHALKVQQDTPNKDAPSNNHLQSQINRLTARMDKRSDEENKGN